MDLDALIAKARETVTERSTASFSVAVAGSPVTFRFKALSGLEWRGLVATHPPRAGAPDDAEAGYDRDGVVVDYPQVYTVDESGTESRVKDFPGVASTLDDVDIEALWTVVWGLNVWEPAKRRARAGKASAGERKKKRS